MTASIRQIVTIVETLGIAGASMQGCATGGDGPR